MSDARPGAMSGFIRPSDRKAISGMTVVCGRGNGGPAAGEARPVARAPPADRAATERLDLS